MKLGKVWDIQLLIQPSQSFPGQDFESTGALWSCMRNWLQKKEFFSSSSSQYNFYAQFSWLLH